MIWHPWADWVTTEPVTGPGIRWASIDAVAIHYTAALNLIDGDPGEDWARIPAYLRSIHHDYLSNRPQPNGATGYSIGYNVAVDARGEAWELRGWDIKCAANAGHNDHTWAILVLVDGQSPVTDAAAATIRELVALATARALRPLLIKGHRDLDATQCPGTGVYAQIQAGTFKPQTDDRPRPVDPPVFEEDDMNAKIIAVDGDTQRAEALLTFGGDGKVKLVGFADAAERQAIVKCGVTRVPLSAAEYDALLAMALR